MWGAAAFDISFKLFVKKVKKKNAFPRESLLFYYFFLISVIIYDI